VHPGDGIHAHPLRPVVKRSVNGDVRQRDGLGHFAVVRQGGAGPGPPGAAGRRRGVVWFAWRSARGVPTSPKQQLSHPHLPKSLLNPTMSNTLRKWAVKSARSPQGTRPDQRRPSTKAGQSALGPAYHKPPTKYYERPKQAPIWSMCRDKSPAQRERGSICRRSGTQRVERRGCRHGWQSLTEEPRVLPPGHRAAR